MFRRRMMRRWGLGYGSPFGYGMPFGYRRRYYRRPGVGCCPGCCLAIVLPGLLAMVLMFAVFAHIV